MVLDTQGSRQPSATSLLHLARFAPAVKLGPHQMFRVGDWVTARGGGGQAGARWLGWFNPPWLITYHHALQYVHSNTSLKQNITL